MLGKKSNDDALLILIERKTRKEIITRVPNKDAISVNEAMKTIFEHYQIGTNPILKTLQQIMVLNLEV